MHRARQAACQEEEHRQARLHPTEVGDRLDRRESLALHWRVEGEGPWRVGANVTVLKGPRDRFAWDDVKHNKCSEKTRPSWNLLASLLCAVQKLCQSLEGGDFP